MEVNEKTQQPLVSVFILTYNHEKYIQQSVEGALMQKCNFPFEIVISDDCSTDRTREICLELQKKAPDKIRLIFNEKNKGIIRNYFGTVAQCRGKYVADCPGDDYWIREDKLQMQVDILEKRDDIGIVHTNWMDLIESTGEIIPDSKSNKRNTKTQILDKSDLHFFLNQRGSCIINMNTSCIRKNLILEIYKKNQYLFDPKLYPCEDFQLLFLILKLSKAYYIDEETFVYRNHQESISGNKDFSKIFNFQKQVTLLKIRLAQDFNIDLKKYIEDQSVLFFTLAYKAQDFSYAQEAKEIMDKYKFSYPLKSKIIYTIVSQKWLLNLTYPTYRFLRKIKRTLKGEK